MKSQATIIQSRSFWLFQIIGWIAYGLIYFLHLSMFEKNYGRQIVFLLLVLVIGLLLTSCLRLLFRRIDVSTLSLTRIIVGVIISSILIGNLWFWGSRLIWIGVTGASIHRLFEARIYGIVYMVFWDSLVIAGWSSLYFTLKFWLEREEQRQRMNQANNLAQQAQLQMLHYQINPQFLFNSLNSIRALISENRSEAKVMITELAEFLRFSLISKEETIVPLQKEIEALRRYYSLEKKRLEEKLEIQFDIAHEATDCQVPVFILQPIIENTIKAGIADRAEALRILLRAHVRDDSLNIEITSNENLTLQADPLESEESDGNFANIEKRLRDMYNGRLEINRFDKYGKRHLIIQIQLIGDSEHVEKF